jgi:hypothetical protein
VVTSAWSLLLTVVVGIFKSDLAEVEVESSRNARKGHVVDIQVQQHIRAWTNGVWMVYGIDLFRSLISHLALTTPS